MQAKRIGHRRQPKGCIGIAAADVFKDLAVFAGRAFRQGTQAQGDDAGAVDLIADRFDDAPQALVAVQVEKMHVKAVVGFGPCVEIARREGCTVFAHGATGKGNDQCRFQLAAEALDPGIEILAPWRIASFRERFPGRKEMIEFCEAKQIPVKASKDKPYSSDENCLHTSYEAGLLEDLTTDGFALVEFGMTVSPQAAPDEPETVAIEFAAGVPVAVNGRRLPPHEIVLLLNEIGGRNGVGRTDIVENRLVEQMTLDRDLVHLRDRLSPEVAESVYYGFWYCAKMDAL
ncbi:MAG: hypothetical protein EBS68_17515, partial [Rhodobacteraceae bacterium]|nr:hypothetical protein [Paracoccaceae bacterium]